MYQFKQIMSSLPRHVPSNPITISPSKCHRKLLQANLPRNVQSETFIENGRSYCRQTDNKNAQIFLHRNHRIALFHNRHLVLNNKENSDFSVKNLKNEKRNIETLEPKAIKNAKEQVPQANTLRKTRTYAKMIADYTESIKSEKNIPKVKESSKGLLSKLPFDAVVSSLTKLERPKIGRKKVSTSISTFTDRNTKEQNNPLTEKNLKKSSKKDIKVDSPKRDYNTQNGRNDENIKIWNLKTPNYRVQSNFKYDLYTRCYPKNDFDFFCEFTERRIYTESRNCGSKKIDSEIKDSKLKRVSQIHTISNNMNNYNQSRNYSRSNSYMKSREENTRKNIKTTEKRENRKSAEPEVSKLFSVKQQSIQQYDRPTRKPLHAKDVCSDSTIKVVRTEEISDYEISKENIIPIEIPKQKSRRNKKMASISKIRRNYEQMLEGQKVEDEKNIQTTIEKKTNSMTNICSKTGKNSIKESVGDSTATLSSSKIVTTSSKKSGIEETKVTVIPKRKEKLERKIEKSIGHESEVKRIPDVLRPIDKRKDGTLIDYGLKVPTRRPRTKEKSNTTMKKTLSAPQRELSHGNPKIDSKSNPDSKLIPTRSELPLSKTSAGNRKTVITEENEVKIDGGPIEKKNENDDGNYRVKSITDGLVNRAVELLKFLKFEQALDGKNNIVKENLSTFREVNCEMSNFKTGSHVSLQSEKSEEKFVYSAWLNRFHTRKHESSII